MSYLRILLLGIALSFLCNCVPESDSVESQKPNIIFLFADDLSYKTVGAYGNTEVQTPTIDALADQGTSFTHTYNMGGWNGAICVASRAMIISGRTMWNAQEISKSYAQGKETDKTWPQLLKQAGYETYMSGKWHIQAKADTIFDHVARTLRGMPFDTPEGYNRPLHKMDTTWTPWDTTFGGYWQGGKHWSELVREDAELFIDQAAEKENPFFMYIAFNAPHDPRQAPKSYVDMYPVENVAVPENFLPIYPYAEEMGAGKNLRDEKLAPFPRTEYAVQVNRQEYYAIISHLDDQLALIIEKLKQKDLMDNTYIFFTADHGLSVGEHGLMGKQSMYDHSVRVPFVVVGPDIPKNKKINHDIYLQDVVATSLELANMPKPAYIEFNSLMPLINADKKSPYDAIYGTYEPESQRMIRKGDYKLIVYPRAQKFRLFNIMADPLEMNDLSDNEDEFERINILFADLIQLQKGMNDPLDLQTMFEILQSNKS